MKSSHKIAVGVIGSFVLGVGAASLLHAQGSAPYYEVAEINVKDQAGYEKSGVDKVRDGIMANGGKVIAGGYNKSVARVGAAPPNRVLIVQWPNKEAADKVWAENVQKWWDSSGSKYASDFRDIGVQGIEQK
jgi:uncharacterized protein (DUF1330 family)